MHLQSVLKLLWCYLIIASGRGVPRWRTAASPFLELKHTEMCEAKLSFIVILETTDPVAHLAKPVDYLPLC